MNQLLLLLFVSVLMAGECGDKKKQGENKGGNGDTTVPACVQKLIDYASKTTPPTTPVQVEEYLYKGKKTYLFTADCCDFYNIAYDENCNQLCAPSGGFTGRGDGKCPSFDSVAKLVKVIWRKT